MGFSKFLAATAASLAGLALASTDSKVLVLTESNFDEQLAANPKGLLVEFYAPWCGHCKSLAPEYDAASLMLEEQNSEYKLAKVDATVEKELGAKYGVQGYPTLKWMVGSQVSDYDGPRERQGIVDWIKAVTGPAVIEGEPDEESPIATLTLYAPESSDAFESIAKKYRKGAKWHHVVSDDKKIVLKHMKEEPIEMKEDIEDMNAISTFFDRNSFPMFGALDGESFAKYSSREGYGMIWGLFKMTADTVLSVVEENREMMTAVSKEVGDKFSVTWTNTAEFGSVMESMFGVTEYPKIVVQLKGGDKKYWLYEGDADSISTESIVDFAKKIMNGEIQPNLKSEPAPAEPQEDPVKVIVGSTMKEKVFTADKDVLLEVYAPWCGHCKKLEPEYIKVGKKVIREGFEDKIVIAKMDGTANDSTVDDMEWTGFPTIFWVKAGASTASTFDGERTAKGMWKWIKKNSTYADEIAAKIASKKEAIETETKKEEL